MTKVTAHFENQTVYAGLDVHIFVGDWWQAPILIEFTLTPFKGGADNLNFAAPLQMQRGHWNFQIQENWIGVR
jgi:hypothetical protein